MKYYTLNHAACVMPRWLRQTLLVMKITTLILFAALMQVSAAGLAQKLTLQKNKTSLRELFAEIKKQTSYNVVWDSKIIENAKPLTVNYKNAEIETVLNEVLPTQGLEYTLSDKTFVIKKKETSLIDRIVARFQTIDVRGKVVDSLGNGLAGATVSVKNGVGSISTDNNGEFYLRNVNESAILIVQYLGYITKEQIAGKEFNYIRLQQSTSKLDEVQVQAYGLTSKRLSTGNITTIKSDEISRQNINNPILALQAKVPNLVISPTSGLPGSSIGVQLRGQNSLTGQRTEPLIVIDGVPIQNTLSVDGIGDFGNIGSSLSSLSFISSDNIESIDVLADADATSIFGSRGGNGVILITTKKGKAGPSQINATISSGYSSIPGKRMDVLNTSQYLEMRKEAIANDGVTAQIDAPFSAGYAPDVLLWNQSRYTDWQKELLGGKPGWTRADLSISGGNTAIQYLVGGNYNRQGYVYPSAFKSKEDAKYETSTFYFNFNGNSQNGKLSIALGGNYSNNNRFGGQTDFTKFAITLAPNAPEIYNSNGDLNWELNPTQPRSAATWDNPFARLLRTSEANTNTLTANANINYIIAKDFRIKLSTGYTDLSIDQLNLTPIESFDPTALIDFNGQIFVPGFANYLNGRSLSWTVDPQLYYLKRIAKGTLNVLIGATFQRQQYYSEAINASYYRDDAFIRNLASAGYWDSSNLSSDYRYFGLFGRATYNFDEKYLVNIGFRRDGSSRFGAENRYGNFWSLGMGWIFTNEEFVKKILPMMTYGKLRASFGTNGNDGIGDYQFLELFRPLTGTYQGINTLTTGATNPYYSWESIKKAELGLETGFFNDRLLINVSYWKTRSGNQLGNVTLPSTGGSLSIVANSKAKVQNSGWDFIVTTENLKSNTFSWQSNLNFGLQYNKLLSFPDGFGVGNLFGNIAGPFPINVQEMVGKPFSGYRYTYEYRGVNPATGIYQFSTRNGNINDPSATFGDDAAYAFAKKITIIPKTLGVTNTFTYKGMSLFTDLQLVRQKSPSYMASTELFPPGVFRNDGTGNQFVTVMNRWQNPGDVKNTQKFTQNLFGDYLTAFNNLFGSSNTPLYVDGSFIRLRNAQISYSIPGKWNQKLRFKNAKIFIQGQNLFTITGYKYADPETKTLFSLPILKTYTAGISLGF
ncbi:SusC/RagA family TonB-linked outer membrane protein [Pedobacter faecalis]|uniref:SusC/RagA family TonB-linked outer membrane protein n=1 Tax=Pedobacter faecalis TaxID=3041495 RepID=UPI00254D4BAB|nr:SusC/RagA family TonB-linked outer membrane protein [Pedobacter sp. ELA7]